MGSRASVVERGRLRGYRKGPPQSAPRSRKPQLGTVTYPVGKKILGTPVDAPAGVFVVNGAIHAARR